MLVFGGVVGFFRAWKFNLLGTNIFPPVWHLWRWSFFLTQVGYVSSLRYILGKGLRLKTVSCSWLLSWSTKKHGFNIPLEHTPSNLYQRAIIWDSFHSGRTGDCLGCALWVCCNFPGNTFSCCSLSSALHTQLKYWLCVVFFVHPLKQKLLRVWGISFTSTFSQTKNMFQSKVEMKASHSNSHENLRVPPRTMPPHLSPPPKEIRLYISGIPHHHNPTIIPQKSLTSLKINMETTKSWRFWFRSFSFTNSWVMVVGEPAGTIFQGVYVRPYTP